jgi:hypothetical protein
LNFYKNNEGVEDLPLRLILVVIVAGMTIPIALYGLSTYSKTQAETALTNEFSNIEITAKQVSNGGNGTSLIVIVDFKNNAFSTIEYVKIGDKINGTYGSVIRYKFSGSDEQRYVLKGGLILTSNSNDTLTLSAGTHDLRLIHITSNTPISYIEVGEV